MSNSLPVPPPIPVPDLIPLAAYDAIIWTSLALALITTSLRLYTRSFVIRAWGIDDTLILLGTLLATGFVGISRWHIGLVWDIVELSRPEGRLLFRENQESIRIYNLIFRSALISDCVYICALPFVKCSILFFYSRIAHLRRHVNLIYFFAFLIVSQAIILFSVTLSSVKPTSGLWDPMYTREQSVKFLQTDIQLTHSSLQVFFDLVILALPIPVILKTKLRKNDRLGLIFIYCLSFFSLAATAVRLSSVVRFSEKVLKLDLISERLNYNYWAILEVATAIICANLPATPAFYRHVTGKGTKTTITGSSLGGTGPSRLSRSFIRHWFTEKSTTLRQTTNRTGTGNNMNDGSISQTGLTSDDKGAYSVDINEMDVMSPSKGTSYSTRVTTKEDDQGNSAKAVSGPAERGSRFYNNEMITSKPPKVISKTRSSDNEDDGLQLSFLEQRGKIYRTDEVNVERSIV